MNSIKNNYALISELDKVKEENVILKATSEAMEVRLVVLESKAWRGGHEVAMLGGATDTTYLTPTFASLTPLTLIHSGYQKLSFLSSSTKLVYIPATVAWQLI